MDQVRRTLAPTELLAAGKRMPCQSRGESDQRSHACRMDLAQLRTTLSVPDTLLPSPEELIPAAASVQVRKLMQERTRHGRIGLASLRAGMHRNTEAKYIRAGKVPTELREPRTWRTRKVPFAEHWEEVAERLEDVPELEAKALFDDLCERYPGRYQEGQLRTLQQRARQLRALEGPEKELFFEQEHRPGEAMQMDFTCANEFGIRVAGAAFPHLLCHPMLPYSNWE